MIGVLSFGALAIGIVLRLFDLISAGLFDVIFAIAMGNTAMALAMKVGTPRAAANAIGLGVPIIALGAQWIFPQIQLSPYLAIVVINVFVAYIFGRGLDASRTPLIVQLIRVSDSGPEGPNDFQNYVYGQGCVWTVFGAFTAILGLIAMLIPSSRETLGIAITALFALQIAWFVLAHYWARLRYKRPETWLGTVRLMARNDIWSELKI